MVNKFNFRNSVDITFWDKSGHSAFGLKRNQAKILGMSLIIAGLILMTPPTFPDPFDVINIFMAAKISAFTGWTPLESLILTYTIIPWLIFLLGIWIYPHNTESLFNGYINKLKKLIKRATKNPIILIALFFIGKYVFHWYTTLI